MHDLQSRAERLSASLERFASVVASADGPVTSASAERDGVTVQVDEAGVVQGVAVAPGWQHDLAPHLLGEHVCDVLAEAWSAQIQEVLDVAPPTPAARVTGDPLGVLRDLEQRLAEVQSAGLPSAPVVETAHARTTHVSGRHDGTITLEIDQVWLGDTTSSAISAELTEVLRELTRPQPTAGDLA